MTKAIIELLHQNSEVTSAYLTSIGNAYKALGFEVEYTYDAVEAGGTSRDIFVVAIASSVIKLGLRGYKNIVFWAQGIWPEESFLRNQSKIRFAIVGFLEKLALKKASKLFLVSNAQRAHYEKKYGLLLSDKSFIQACSNEVFHERSFDYSGKYDNPVFVYAGGLQKYQGIDALLDVFGRVAKLDERAVLLFYTRDQQEARLLARTHGIEDKVRIGFAAPEELHEILAKAKYGLVIREDNAINRVATPTKLSTYIANGIIPIFSECLTSFEETSRDLTKLPYNPDTFEKDFVEFEGRAIDANEIKREYQSYFVKQFDLNRSIEDMKKFLNDKPDRG